MHNSIDNPKCAITRACFHDPEVQGSYGELAEGYGFRIAPCPPREPQKKGLVEAGVKDVKNNFLGRVRKIRFVCETAGYPELAEALTMDRLYYLTDEQFDQSNRLLPPEHGRPERPPTVKHREALSTATPGVQYET